MTGEYYVYILKDPRNDKPFYVGKGKEDRVYAHARDALQNYNGESKDPKEKRSDKISLIKEIIASGNHVVAIKHRIGLDEETALEVEAALIDYIPELANEQGGYASDRGPRQIPHDETTLKIKKAIEKGKSMDYSFLKDVIEYYNSICDKQFKAFKCEVHDRSYQIAIKENLKEGLHYEFQLHKGLQLGIELHIERKYLNKLNDVIKEFKGNIQGYDIKNKKYGQGKNNHLKIIVPTSVGKEKCSLIMKDLIDMTYDKMIEGCKNL
jgi:hypothetical protein